MLKKSHLHLFQTVERQYKKGGTVLAQHVKFSEEHKPKAQDLNYDGARLSRKAFQIFNSMVLESQRYVKELSVLHVPKN